MSPWHRALPALLLCATLPAGAPGQELETRDERAIYAMGLAQARQLKNLSFTAAELELFQRAMADEFAGRPKLKLEDQVAAVRQLRDERRQRIASSERAAAAEFAKEASAEADAQTTESGLIFTSIREGLGERPTVVDTVEVHYRGTLRDGTVFDSSKQRGGPAQLALNRVIPCWTEGVQKMKAGGKARLVCPPDLAYGDRGQGQLIKPGAILIFEVELLSIVQ